MEHWRNTDASTGMIPSMRYESLVASMAEHVEPMPRDVFVYPGTMAEFRAALMVSGVEMRGIEIGMPGPAPGPFGPHPIGGLECYEVGGQVWVAGCYRDFLDARDGKIPVTRLKSG